MADVRASFCVLEDATSKAGMPLTKVAEGDAIASKNALAGLVAKDGSDELAYLKVDANGKLLVAFSEIAELYDSDTHAGDKDAYQAVATVTLTVDKNYSNLHMWASCYRDAVFQLIHNNNGTPAILVDGVRVGSGQFSFAGIMKQLKFTAGSTGTQQLIIKGKNESVASTMTGVIGIDESV
jgi:hypothetical protein